MNHWDDDFLLGGVAVAKKEESIGKVKGGVTARFNVFFIIVVTVGLTLPCSRPHSREQSAQSSVPHVPIRVNDYQSE